MAQKAKPGGTPGVGANTGSKLTLTKENTNHERGSNAGIMARDTHPTGKGVKGY